VKEIVFREPHQGTADILRVIVDHHREPTHLITATKTNRKRRLRKASEKLT
jgi:hypothetical protein